MIVYAEATFLGDIPDYPPPVPSVWRGFSMLSMGRSSNGFGVNPISFADIVAWCTLFSERLTEWDMMLLREIDMIFIRYLNAKTKEPESTTPTSLISSFRAAFQEKKK